MAEKSTIGCQTNGKLLTGNKALSLFRAALNKVCISLDTTDPGMFQKVRSGGKFGDVLAAFTTVESAQKKEPSLDIEIGVEVVLMKKMFRNCRNWFNGQAVTELILFWRCK